MGSHFNQWLHARWIVNLECIISSIKKRRASDCTQNLLEKLYVQHKLVTEYWLYPEYRINVTDFKVSHLQIAKKEKHQQLMQAELNRFQILKEKRYYVSLPTNSSWITNSATLQIDPILSQYIEDIVRNRTTNADTVQKLLKSRVSLRCGSFLPDKLDRAFYSTKDDNY